KKLKEDALKTLGFTADKDSNLGYVAINTLPWPRSEIVKLSDVGYTAEEPKYALVAGGMGVIAAKVLDSTQSVSVSVNEVTAGVFRLSNGKLQLEVCRGVITSLMDLTEGREVIAKDRKGNQLVIFDDKPLYWQAWDVEVYHLDCGKEVSSGETTIAENSPHRVSLVTETKISDKSWVKTTISL